MSDNKLKASKDAARRILIVDDNRPWAETLKLRLEEVADYEICIESDSRRAVTVGREFRPHCVLLDIQMPCLDGGDVAARYGRDPDLRHIPIAFLTGMLTEKEANARRKDQHGQVFFPKMVNIPDLVKFIETVK